MTGLVNIERDSESFSDIATLSLWYQFASLPSSDFNAFFNGTQWETRLLDEPGEQVSSFLQALHEQAPERYGSFLDGYKERLQRKFCLSFETLTLEERDNDVYIEFIINESVGAESINNQAVSRLQHLWRWFPRYTRYCSQGFDVRTGGTPITPDDSHKEMANTTLAQMAHVSKNVLYNRLINERYTAPSLDEWLKQWYQVRKQWLMLVEAVGSVYESRYRGKTPDYRAVRSLGAEVLRLYVQTPDLPEKVREQLQQQVQTIRTWGNTVHAFVQQFFQHNPEENNHDAFLMRVNLRDALRTLPEMHTAFRHVFAFAIDEMNMQLLNTKESREYMYLYDILDYWFTVPTRSASNLRHTVKIWREQEERDQANAVRESLSELAEAGMSFSYPNGLVSIDTALTGLCIGYEIIDFEQQPVQIGLICQYISGIDINYSFLYLVPTVQRHLHGSVIRISRENLQRIAAGEAVNDVYPVSAPVGLTAILPDIDLTPLPEVTLFSPAAEACVRLVMERNRIYFARTHLQQNTAESQTILQYYEHSAAEKAREAVDSFGVAYAGAINWSVPNNALPAWRELWEGCRTLVEELSDHNTIIGGYLPQPALQFPILDQLYNRYLNIRYRM